MVEEVLISMQYSTDPTLLLESVDSTKVLMPIQSLDDPTLLFDNVDSTKVVTSIQYLVDPTLLMVSDVSTNYVFNISSSVLSEQGGIPLTSRKTRPIPRMVYFDWNDLVEPLLPYSAPFQIRVEVNSIFFYLCIVDEEASIIILSSSAWKAECWKIFNRQQNGKYLTDIECLSLMASSMSTGSL
jgi:hypothetical protein